MALGWHWDGTGMALGWPCIQRSAGAVAFEHPALYTKGTAQIGKSQDVQVALPCTGLPSKLSPVNVPFGQGVHVSPAKSLEFWYVPGLHGTQLSVPKLVPTEVPRPHVGGGVGGGGASG